MNTTTEFDLGNLELLESLPEAEPIDEVMADKTEDLKSDLILS